MTGDTTDTAAGSGRLNPRRAQGMLIDRVPARCRGAMLMAAALTAVAVCSAPATADIEKWVDRDGQVHYGDEAPPSLDAIPLTVQPNLIETQSGAVPALSSKQFLDRRAPLQAVEAAPAPRRDIQAYVKQCRDNRGVDCEREAHAMIDGPAPVIFPGDPAIFPRPDLKPPPPGLRLKFGIRPIK